MKTLRRFGKVRIVLAVVVLTSIFALVGQVSAGLLCRADPVVILSNGVVIDFGATISTLPMQVQEVHYELHVPTGVTMVAAIHTPAWLTSQETFTVYSDQPAGQYVTSVVVHTTVGNATVDADATLIGVLGLRLARAVTSGVEGQVLVLTLRS